MALQFANITELQNDLVSKPGIYATDSVQLVSSLEGFEIHDQAIIREYIDEDGTKRYQVATQQVLKDTSDDTWGYGTNRQWGDFDKSQTTFEEELIAKTDSYEGQTVGGNVIDAVIVDRVDKSSKSGLVTAYLSDGSQIQVLFKKNDNDTWTIRPQV